MAVKNGFQIERRVGIAMDSLSASQKAALQPVLQTKEGFVAQARRPGAIKKLSASKPLYSMKAGAGMRVIFTIKDGGIFVQDIMRKATMDRLVTKRKSNAKTLKKEHGGTSVKRGDEVKTVIV